MMKKIIVLILCLIAGYNAIYFKKLSKMTEQKSKNFDFKAYADSLFYQGIVKNNGAIDIDKLLTLNMTDTDAAFSTYGNRLGIGNSAYFMISSEGKIVEKSDEGLKLMGPSGISKSIDTKYIFGNAIRDASGLVKLTDFKTNADFNKLSEALNTVVREKSIPADLKTLNVGDQVKVTGAIKLTKGASGQEQISVLPIKIIKI